MQLKSEHGMNTSQSTLQSPSRICSAHRRVFDRQKFRNTTRCRPGRKYRWSSQLWPRTMTLSLSSKRLVTDSTWIQQAHTQNGPFLMLPGNQTGARGRALLSLSLSLSLSPFLSLSLSLSLSLNISIYLSISLSLYISLSFSLSLFLSLYFSLHFSLSISLSFSLLVSLFLSPCLSLSTPEIHRGVTCTPSSVGFRRSHGVLRSILRRGERLTESLFDQARTL